MKKILTLMILTFSLTLYARDNEKSCSPHVIQGPCKSSGIAELTIITCDGTVVKDQQTCTPKIAYSCEDLCRSDYTKQYRVREYRGSDRREGYSYIDSPEFYSFASCKEAMAKDIRCQASCN